MRLALMLATDVREGFSAMRRPLLALVAIEFILAFLCVLFSFGAELGLGDLSSDDFLASIFGGMAIYDAASNMPFQLPIAWLFITLVVFYLPLAYPLRDLSGFGSQVLVASGGRIRWWISKCLWLGLYACIVWLSALGVSHVCSLLASGGVGYGVSQDVGALMAFDTWDFTTVPRSAPLDGFVLSAFMMTWALCLLQLTASLWIRPTLSFALISSIMFSSAFAFSPVLPGQYLMVARSSLVISSGVRPIWGLSLAALLLVSSSLIGGWRFSHMDLLGRGFSL